MESTTESFSLVDLQKSIIPGDLESVTDSCHQTQKQSLKVNRWNHICSA